MFYLPKGDYRSVGSQLCLLEFLLWCLEDMRLLAKSPEPTSKVPLKSGSKTAQQGQL